MTTIDQSNPGIPVENVEIDFNDDGIVDPLDANMLHVNGKYVFRMSKPGTLPDYFPEAIQKLFTDTFMDIGNKSEGVPKDQAPARFDEIREDFKKRALAEGIKVISEDAYIRPEDSHAGFWAGVIYKVIPLSGGEPTIISLSFIEGAIPFDIQASAMHNGFPTNVFNYGLDEAQSKLIITEKHSDITSGNKIIGRALIAQGAGVEVDYRHPGEEEFQKALLAWREIEDNPETLKDESGKELFLFPQS